MVYDDLFSSVPNVDSGGLSNDGILTEDQWETLIECGVEKFVDEDKPNQLPSLSDDWLTENEVSAREENRAIRRSERQLEEIRRRSASEGARTTPSGGETAPSEGVDNEVEFV